MLQVVSQSPKERKREMTQFAPPISKCIETINANARRVIISLNPKAGRRSSSDLAYRLADILQSRGFQAEVETDIATIKQLSDEYHDAGILRAVVGVGGDGTQSLLLNTIPEGANLCMFPQGTENVLGKYLGIKPSPDAIADLLEQGQVLPMDAGQVTDTSGKQYLFCLMAGCGFDATVCERLAARRTGHITKFSYIKPVIASLWNYSFPLIEIDVLDGDQEGFTARFLFFMNIDRYALGLRIAPNSSPIDGKIDGCGFRKSGLFHGLRYFWKLCRKTHTRSPEYATRSASEFRIHTTSAERVPVQLDGDPCTELPVTLTTLPGRLRILVPQAYIDQISTAQSD